MTEVLGNAVAVLLLLPTYFASICSWSESTTTPDFDEENIWSRDRRSLRFVLELGVRWYTVVYILDVYIECLPRVS
jgi:hypothetical protein